MIPSLSPLVRALPFRTQPLLAKMPPLGGIISFSQNARFFDKHLHNNIRMNRLKFQNVSRFFHDFPSSSEELHKKEVFDHYIIKDLLSIFQFTFSPNLSVRENLKKAPYPLQKQVSFLICMENLAYLKNEEGLNFQDIQEHPELSKQILEAQNLSLFKFPQAVIDVLIGPTSSLKEKIAEELSSLHEYQIESFSPIFQKNPAILESLCASQIIKPRQISLSFFPSHAAFIDFVRKQPQTGLEFLGENLRNQDLFSKEELLSIAMAHQNPYLFTKFFLFDPKSLKILDEMAKNSPSTDTHRQCIKTRQTKKIEKLASTLCKMFIMANVLIVGAVLKKTS